MQRRPREIGADDPGEGQVGSGEIRAREIGADQFHAMQVGAREIGMSEVGAAQVEAGEIVAAHVPAGEIRLARRHAGEHRPHLLCGEMIRGLGRHCPGCGAKQRQKAAQTRWGGHCGCSGQYRVVRSVSQAGDAVTNAASTS